MFVSRQLRHGSSLAHRPRAGARSWARQIRGAAGLVALALVPWLNATENVPRKPFAEWANVPDKGQWSVRLWYLEAEAYHIWAPRRRYEITSVQGGENYGIDRTQGLILMEYGITARWAADLNVGYGTVGTRSFNPYQKAMSTSGLLDTSLGVRYQLLTEERAADSWLPVVSFRASGILPGSFDKNFPFAPGQRSAAIEPALLMRKHFGWPGFGAYADVFYRWMKTTTQDQYAAAIGFYQDLKGWNLSAGYRHFQQIGGVDLRYEGVSEPLAYSPEVREISDAIEAGFSYTTSKRHWRWGFYARTTFDGSNTDSAFWVSGYLEIPFGGNKKETAPY